MVEFYLALGVDADRTNNKVKVDYIMIVPIKYLNTLRQSLKGLEQRWEVLYEPASSYCVANDFFHQEPLNAKIISLKLKLFFV